MTTNVDIASPGAYATDIATALTAILNLKQRFNGTFPDPGTGSGTFVDLKQDVPGRDLMHFATTANAAQPFGVIAIGVDYNGVGIIVRNKDSGVGNSWEHGIGRDGTSKDTVSTSTSYMLQGTSYSTVADFMNLLQENTGPNAATTAVKPMIHLVSQGNSFASGVDSLTQKLMLWTVAGGDGGYIDATSGVLRSSAGIKVSALADGNVVLGVKARDTQTGALTQWMNSSEVPLSQVTATGKFQMAVNNFMGPAWRYLGSRSADPTTDLQDEDFWVRSDTFELKFRIGGATKKVALT